MKLPTIHFELLQKKMVDGNITQQEKTAYLDMNYSVQNTYAIASNTTKKYLSWNSNTIMT